MFMFFPLGHQMLFTSQKGSLAICSIWAFSVFLQMSKESYCFHFFFSRGYSQRRKWKIFLQFWWASLYLFSTIWHTRKRAPLGIPKTWRGAIWRLAKPAVPSMPARDSINRRQEPEMGIISTVHYWQMFLSSLYAIHHRWSCFHFACFWEIIMF